MTPVNLTKKNRCMRKQTLRPFFHFRFLYTDFYDRQKYWGGGRHPCRPCSDAHAILRSFSKSVLQTSCGQFMQFVGHECRLQHRRGATMLANKPPGII